MRYPGPLRDEPIAVELHNTIYATSGGAVDGLADPASMLAWLEALAPRLYAGALWPGGGPVEDGGDEHGGGLPADPGGRPAPTPSSARSRGLPAGPWPSAEELVALRDVVRAALQAAAAGSAPARADVHAVNAASRRAPRSPAAVWQPEGQASLGTDLGDASRADAVVAAFATDAIGLLTGPRREDLRTCGAPRCVLMFLSDHPRREWCSERCGNRARQARHYQRHGHRP